MVVIDWYGVRERVGTLARRDEEKGVFGAWSGNHGHRFQLAPPLTESQLRQAEEQFRITLPEDYRGFLLQVGAGGAGPAYGIAPLQHLDGVWRWGKPGEDTDPTRLHQPFPAQEVIAAAWAEVDARRPAVGDFADSEKYGRALHAWDAEGELLFDQFTVGAICLCHKGCGTFDWLVVSGPERGTVWFDDRAADQGLTPLGKNSGRVSFSEWYLGWLQAAEAKVNR